MKPEGLSHEEIIKLEPCSEAYMAATEVRIGVKRITFSSKRHRQFVTDISFERGIAHTGSPDFNIMIHELRPITQTCSLGHLHETGKKSEDWGRIQLSWEQAQQLVDWFNEGDWKEVRARRAERVKKMKELGL